MGSMSEEREKAGSLAALGMTNQKNKGNNDSNGKKQLSSDHCTSRTRCLTYGEQFLVEATDLALSVYEVDLQNPVALLTLFI